MHARFYEKSADARLRCRLCPHNCRIAPGRHGLCLVRFNRDGDLDLPFYGALSSVAVDPIEKKPLYHFHPGAQILSVGFVGCSFHCPFCQNYRISTNTAAPTEEIGPQELVELAVRERSFGIAYTYSEPLVHMEYVLETARLARGRGLANVLVSNGYVNPEPAEELLELLDAANIDLKGFDPQFYRREIGGNLAEVKRFLSQAHSRVELEVTTLVIPTKNDSPEEIEGIARFLASLRPDIPYHLSAYYPQYRYTLPPTSAATLRKLAQAARRHLHHVYLGNVGAEEALTRCAACNAVLVRRRGYSVQVTGIDAGRCTSCGAASPVVV